MKPYGFAGAWQRLERAREHFDEVRERATLYHAVVRDVGDPVGGLYHSDPLMVLRRIVEIPERIGIVGGETIYNLRASLDYLVFALSWHDTGQRPIDDTARSLQFPIYSTAEKFDANAVRLLSGLSNEHVAQIRSYQPFSCGWIGDLADLSNEDKHRHLLWLIGLLAKEEAWEHRWWTRDGQLVRDSDISAFDTTELLYEDVAHVQVALEDGRPLVEVLERLVEETATLLQTFASEFTLAPLKDEEEERMS